MEGPEVPLTALYSWWPWKPAAQLREPSSELGYWLTRAEAARGSSGDLMRAVLVEISAVIRHADRRQRRVDSVFTLITALCAINGLVAYIIEATQLQRVAPVTTIVLVLASNVGALIIWRRVACWVTNHHAHRAVLARERLDRWLPPMPPKVLRPNTTRTTNTENASITTPLQ